MNIINFQGLIIFSQKIFIFVLIFIFQFKFRQFNLSCIGLRQWLVYHIIDLNRKYFIIIFICLFHRIDCLLSIVFFQTLMFYISLLNIDIMSNILFKLKFFHMLIKALNYYFINKNIIIPNFRGFNFHPYIFKSFYY